MKWRVPLFDPDIDEREVEAVAAVVRSKWLTMGDRTAEFERLFAEFCGCRHAVAVNSATAALHIALVAAHVREGDDVLVPALTFVATANAIRYCGARPVFADVHSYDDWNVSVETLEAVLTPATRAIIVVHYAGYPCAMDRIVPWAREHGIAVVEDAAHAPGASLQGRAMGTWGDGGCFSFFSNKNMTTGEGGMVTTDSDDVAARLRRLRSHGMTTVTLDRHKGHAFSYDVTDLGYNYRMSEMNAAMGICQLERLPEANRRRNELVRLYRRLLAERGIEAPFAAAQGEPTPHIMPVLLPTNVERQTVMERMRDQGIQTSIHYRPIDTFAAYRDAGLGPATGAVRAHDIGNRELTLPLFPSMSEPTVRLVCDALSDAIRGGR